MSIDILTAEVSEMAERVGVKFVPFAAPAADKGAPEILGSMQSEDGK